MAKKACLRLVKSGSWRVTFCYTETEQSKLEAEQGYKLSKPTPALSTPSIKALRSKRPITLPQKVPPTGG